MINTISSSYPCLEYIFMVPKVFEPLKFYCISNLSGSTRYTLVLEVLFTHDSEVEDLFCGASSRSEPSLFFSNYFFSLGFKPIQDNFQHDFA